jgi:hypothetical protein
MEIAILFTIEEAEAKIQNRINDIIKNKDSLEFDKLPGLIEALKIILDCKKTEN